MMSGLKKILKKQKDVYITHHSGCPMLVGQSLHCMFTILHCTIFKEGNYSCVEVKSDNNSGFRGQAWSFITTNTNPLIIIIFFIYFPQGPTSSSIH